MTATLASSALAQAPTPARTIEWPAPPEPARIRYLRSLDPSSVRPRRSLLSRALRAIVGGGNVPVMAQPYGVTVGPDRRIYVADTQGGVIHVYNLEKPDYSAIHVDFDSLIGVAYSGGRLFVTDSASGRVAAVDARGRTLWTRGPRDGFSRPTGIVAAGDRLYVVDTARSRVVVLSTEGKTLDSFGARGAGPGEFNFPTNIARTSDGRLCVTDSMNFRVQVFNEQGRFIKAFGQLGDGSGDFDKPKGVAVDSEGHIYVVEGFHDVVQIFDADGRLLLSFGGSGRGAGELWLPTGIAIVNDVVYVTDSANRRVQMFERLRNPR